MNNQPNTFWRFIANPVAGQGKVKRRWNNMERQLRKAGIRFEVVFTERKFHAADLAQEAIEQGCRHLVAVGGDGTAHEVINGIFRQTACPPREVTFALLPVGTGNDWIKTHRIPKNFRRWLAYFQAGKTSYQDVGWLTYRENGREKKRYFFNVAGLSYDGYVARQGERYRHLVTNTLFYLFLIFRCLFQFRIPKSGVTFDGQVITNRFYTINAGICRYSGGGIQLVPHAQPADGKLALTLVRRVSKLEVLLVTPLFYLGKIGWHPAVSMFQVENIAVESLDEQPVLVEADGEFLGKTPVRIGILRKALKIYAAE
jgi:YegS/Rv2252/BmrU family lipid kinase